jgi:TPP-dependent trihydroxycyclohexane-1,2-dione (THcHDO) dehydratase
MFCWLPIVKKFIENKNIAYIIINDHMAPSSIFFDGIQMREQVLEVEDEELVFVDAM